MKLVLKSLFAGVVLTLSAFASAQTYTMPSVNVQPPVYTQPSVNVQAPSVYNQQPSVNVQAPSVYNQQPSYVQPSVNAQAPTVYAQQPSIPAQQVYAPQQANTYTTQANSNLYTQPRVYVGIDAFKDRDAKTAVGFTVGLKLDRNLGVELTYRQQQPSIAILGGGDLKSNTFRLVGVGEMPIVDNFVLYGDLGLAYLKTSGYGLVASTNTTGIAAGVGVKYYFSPVLNAFLKYEYNGKGGQNFKGLGAGLHYLF